MLDGLRDDLGGVLLEQVNFVEDVDVVVLDAQQQDRVCVVETKVLPDGYVVVVVQVLGNLPDLPVVQDQAADFAPFTYSLLQTSRIRLPSACFHAVQTIS